MSEGMKGMVKHNCLIKTVVEFIRLRIYAEDINFEIWEVKEKETVIGPYWQTPEWLRVAILVMSDFSSAECGECFLL